MHLKYLSYVVRHKWFVYLAGRKLGVSFWQLLKHDWTKFLPSEWTPYVRYFYGDFPDAAETGRMVIDFGHSPRDFKDVVKAEFDAAWNHHQKRNPHHWQYWYLVNDSEEPQCIEMPLKYAREMLADWAGAGRAITGKWEVAEWYQANKEKIKLHVRTRDFVEGLLRHGLDGLAK